MVMFDIQGNNSHAVKTGPSSPATASLEGKLLLEHLHSIRVHPYAIHVVEVS